MPPILVREGLLAIVVLISVVMMGAIVAIAIVVVVPSFPLHVALVILVLVVSSPLRLSLPRVSLPEVPLLWLRDLDERREGGIVTGPARGDELTIALLG